jgi:hypothetical protein
MITLNLDKDNRMLRFGFGKHDGQWFVRLDLWKNGYRWTFGNKPKEDPYQGFTVTAQVIHCGNAITLLTSDDEYRYKLLEFRFVPMERKFVIISEDDLTDYRKAKDQYDNMVREIFYQSSNSEFHHFMQMSTVKPNLV